jgi:hypothetical protein
VRAIAFCAVSTLLLALALAGVTRNALVSLGVTAAYAIFLITRPRMQRVIGRLSDKPNWDGYYWHEPRRPGRR